MIRKFFAGFLLILSAVFFFMYDAFYFQWRDCFNDQGRCFDEATGVVYHAQSGMVWLALALSTAALCAYQIWRLIRAR